jgi:hypothetical protein
MSNKIDRLFGPACSRNLGDKFLACPASDQFLKEWGFEEQKLPEDKGTT